MKHLIDAFQWTVIWLAGGLIYYLPVWAAFSFIWWCPIDPLGSNASRLGVVAALIVSGFVVASCIRDER